MFKIRNNKIYITRGDSAVLSLDITDADGNSYTPAGNDSLLFTVKVDTATSSHLIQKSITGGKVTLDPVDTESLPYGDYVYDVQLRMADGYVDTIIPPSLFRVEEEVTF